MEWQIWRMDDHGNEFFVESFPTKNEANQRIAKLTAGVHKQTYWVVSVEKRSSCSLLSNDEVQDESEKEAQATASP